jgi:hypothetical protein
MQPNQNLSPSPNMTTPTSNSVPEPDYNFILQPPQKRPKLKMISGNGSPLSRLVMVLVGFLILLILFSLVKSLLSTSPFNTNDLLSVVQRQSEIAHILSTDLATNNEQTSLNTNNQNFAATALLSINSSQSQIINYLTTNKVKLKTTQIQVILDPSLDNQLSSSLQSNNFNQTFNQIMQNQLSLYELELSTAYKSTSGPKGKILLKSTYQGAQLLNKQLNLPTS